MLLFFKLFCLIISVFGQCSVKHGEAMNQPCPPCASRPEIHRYETRAKRFNPLKKIKHRHFSPDTYELQRLSVIRDTDEEFVPEIVDLSKYQLSASKPFSRRPNIIENNLSTSTVHSASTIPTATPSTFTRSPGIRIMFRSYMKRRRIPKFLVGSPSVTMPATNGKSMQESNELKVVPTGYKTNPNFAPEEVPIENDRCNDRELQKILVEGMRVDDSVMSKRTIGAILSASKRNHVSVLCSDQEVAFRLVARKHCQLGAGKATCILFVL